MQKFHPGHKFSAKQRTTDVLTEEQVDFESLLLSSLLLKGLNDSGFEKPSPIQLKAIPLGRCGLDLIAQAKSGTGKTCVFSVIALENIILDNHTTQVLILAPTREIAVQIKDVVNAIGCHMKGLSCQVFIGGLPLDNDKKALKGCHIAVGSPGRIKSLIENKHLKTDSIRMFILDEADKLLDENFQEQVNWIFSTLSANKQMMAFSATYPEYLANHLTRYMREPTFVRLNAADPTLQGIKQFYCVVPFHQLPHKIFQEKVEQLLRLLSKVNFHQCLLFSNFQIRAQSLSSTLCAKGWPATFISGSQTQQKRLQAIEKLKAFKCRILISTDLTARGIDAENVNLVVNMDVPRDGETYLHRIGRAGRFGTKGVAVTFVAKGKEEEKMKQIEKSIGIAMEALPDHIPDSVMVSRSLSCESQEWVTHDTVEVNVLHRSTATTKDEPESKSKLTAGGKIDACIELNESKDDKESKTTQEYIKNFLHKNENLTAQNLSPQSTRAMPDGYENIIEVTHPKHTLSELGNLDNKQLEKHGLVEYGLLQNQDKVPELPSVDEFEKDFEEYLALASTFENLGLQEESDSQVASVMDNLNFKETKEMSNLKDVQNYGSDKTAVDSEVDEKLIFSKASTSIRVDEVNEGHISGGNDDDDDGGGGGGDDYDNEDDTSVDDSDSDDDDGDNDSIEDDEGSTDDSVDDDSIDNKSIDGNRVVDANDENDENELEEDLKKGDHNNVLDSHAKGQSCFSNDMLLERSKKDKNYNDTEDIDVDQSSEGDQSDKDHNESSCIGNDGDDDGDDEGYNCNDDDGYNGNDNGGDDGSGSGVGNRDDDDDDDDDDSPSDGASPTCDNYEVLNGKKSRKKEMQLPAGYVASQGSEQNYGTNSTTFAQYYRRSTAPGYYWNTKYRPTHKKRCYPANTMLCNYPGMLPWQQVTCMHGDLNLRPNQQIYLRPSVFFCDSTGENKHYLPHPQMERTNGHFVRSTENAKNKQRENQCHTKVHSPINEATLGQHRETFWSTTWHNAYHNINNAIQQFAAQNSQRY